MRIACWVSGSGEAGGLPGWIGATLMHERTTTTTNRGTNVTPFGLSASLVRDSLLGPTLCRASMNGTGRADRSPLEPKAALRPRSSGFDLPSGGAGKDRRSLSRVPLVDNYSDERDYLGIPRCPACHDRVVQVVDGVVRGPQASAAQRVGSDPGELRVCVVRGSCHS